MGIDGYDMQLAAYTAPWLIKTWMIERASFGAVFGAGLTGYLVGALLLSMAGDRRGRKPVILRSTALFAVVTLISVTATSRELMMLYRFVAGIGLGGCIANVIALAAEVAPRSERVRVVALLFAGYTGGAALGGALSAMLIPRLGWESAFILGGTAPLLLIPVLRQRLHESARFLAGLPAGAARLRPLMTRFAPDIDFATARFASSARTSAASLPLKGLFAEGRALLTVVLWTAFVTSFLGHHFVTSWLPTLLNGMGVSLPRVVLAGSLLQAGAFVGCIFVALTADRRGIIVTALAFLCAAPLVVAIGHFGGDPGVGMLLVFAAGICLIGGQTGLNALAAGFYDTEFRATGAGWALGVGRIGAILGPVAGGMLLSAGVPDPELFAWAAVPALVCAATVFMLHFLARTTETQPSESTR
jgi:AAHS family 4-hydroxybenzoate transporter-like MFS transporter